MKIISKFVDYYDFASPYWANSDTVFVRHSTEKPIGQLGHSWKRKHDFLSPYYLRPIRHEKQNRNWTVRCSKLIIAGTLYRLYEFTRIRDPFQLTDAERKNLSVSEYNAIGNKERYTFETDEANEFVKDLKKDGYIYRDIFGKTENDNSSYGYLNEEFGAPILYFDYDESSYTVMMNPKLSDIYTGIPADQVYQNIEMWLNREKPVPLELGNDEKIQKAGFDLKKSFRHRK